MFDLNKMVWNLYAFEYKCPNNAWMNMHEYVCMDDYIYAIRIIALHVHEDIA